MAPGKAYLPRGPFCQRLSWLLYISDSGRGMAESQGIFDYSAATVNSLTASLSPARLAPYLVRAHGDPEMAFQFYLWNARLSKAFLFPLNVGEVAFRNAVHSAFSQKWGENWVFAPHFVLNDHSQASHGKPLDRLVTAAAEAFPLPAPLRPDDMVAALTFDFWSNLFRKEYDEELWSDPALIVNAFPHLPAGWGRGRIQQVVSHVNWFRNRIAHHEPILAENHGKVLSSILQMIGWTSSETRAWTRAHATVIAVSKTPPTLYSRILGRPLAQSNLRPPQVVAPNMTLLDLMALLSELRPQIALFADGSALGYAAVSTSAVNAYIGAAAVAVAGLVDLSQHSVADVVATQPILLARIDRRATTGDAQALLFPSDTQAARPQALLVVEGGSLIGLIEPPSIRL